MTFIFRFSKGLLFVAALIISQLVVPARAVAQDVAQYNKPDIPPSPAFNPPSQAKIILGQRLFFDTRLSGGNTMSCASCHQPDYNWTDPRPLSLGETGKSRPRRTPTLQDIGWNILFARDGRVETLEGFVLGPIAHADEMNQPLDILSSELSNTEDYPALFKAAFHGTSISIDQIAQSLAAFVRTIRSGTAPFDRWIAGEPEALSPAAKDGFEVFTGKAGCSNCHTGWRFSDQKFYDIGIETKDRGRGLLMPGSVHLQFAFKTPSLRNVANRPPYMHNSSLKTLEQVIDFYITAGQQRPSLAGQRQTVDLDVHERLNLVEFLKSLSDSNR